MPISNRPARTRSRRSAATIPPEPTPEQVASLAASIADDAVHREAPGRSIATWVQHNLGGHSALVQARVREAAKRALLAAAETAAERGDGYTSKVGAALALGVSEDDIGRWLRTRRGRASLGHPVHVGNGCFRIPWLALGRRRAEFLQGLPIAEPPHPEPLPAGYEP